MQDAIQHPAFSFCRISKCKRAKQKAQFYFLLYFSRRRMAMKLSKLFFHIRKLQEVNAWGVILNKLKNKILANLQMKTPKKFTLYKEKL